jgi:hypothetical protein
LDAGRAPRVAATGVAIGYLLGLVLVAAQCYSRSEDWHIEQFVAIFSVFYHTVICSAALFVVPLLAMAIVRLRRRTPAVNLPDQAASAASEPYPNADTGIQLGNSQFRLG